MKHTLIPLIGFLSVSACGMLPERQRAVPEAVQEVAQTRPVARPAGVAPPSTARTADQFDTTTAAERSAAVEAAQATSGARNLGSTIASLGSVTEPGIWMKTPLAKTAGKGRVDYPEKGTSVVVDLIPLEGDPGAGSQLSLAAMRLLDAGLTDLPEVQVFATGG